MDLRWRVMFAITAVAGVIVLLFVSYTIFSLKFLIASWLYPWIIIVVSIVLILFGYQLSRRKKEAIILFEKTLHGGLHHFQCPRCFGLFAVKESRKNNIHFLTLTCPICGSIGRITSHPPLHIDQIPPEKSPRVTFFCKGCKERINIWAEGSTLSEKIFIFSCPYCGSKRPMNRQ